MIPKLPRLCKCCQLPIIGTSSGQTGAGMKKAVVLLQCVAEAVMQQGIAEWAKAVPGGEFMFNVARDTWEKYRARVRVDAIKVELEALVQARQDEINSLAAEVAAQATPDPRVQQQLAAYLAQIPGATRQSQKRAADPTGRTVAADFALNQPEDLVRILPPAPPRWVAGDELPSRPGWRLERLLGVGGFGEVWLARHTQLHSLKPGAVKFCRNGGLQHEAAVINRLLGCGEQAHVVTLRDADLSGAQPWLMYDYVAGGDLGDLLHRWASLPLAQRQPRVLQTLTVLAETVSRFHALSPAIVHRDLKPANILCDAQDQLYITDFGIGGLAAQAQLAGASRLTAAGRLQTAHYGSCTPLYASPQQQLGQPPNPQDDVHALGVIGYQLLTGQMHQGVGPDLAEELQELGVMPELIALTKACTARPNNRLADAGVLLQRLRPLQPQQSPAAAPASAELQRLRQQREATEARLRALEAEEAERQRQAEAEAEHQRQLEAERQRHAEAERKLRELEAKRNPEARRRILTPQDIHGWDTVQVQTLQRQVAEALGQPVEQKLKLKDGTVLELVLIPPGKFLMGSPKTEPERSSDEQQHPVTISEAFYVGKYPVTQAQWEAVMGSNPSHFKGANLPVEMVSWNDITQQFLPKLNALTGKKFRLLTEAQWEYSCRAGTTTAYSFGNDASQLGNYAWYADNSGGRTHPVGQKKPNPWGLYDLYGNVSEWTCSGYEFTYNGEEQRCGSSAKHRVWRGGALGNPAPSARSAYRIRDEPHYRRHFYGFRLALGQ